MSRPKQIGKFVTLEFIPDRYRFSSNELYFISHGKYTIIVSDLYCIESYKFLLNIRRPIRIRGRHTIGGNQIVAYHISYL